jgi:excisionase family DNA binding protein
MKAVDEHDQRDPLIDDGFADVGAAAEYLGLGRSSVYKLMDAGELPYAKFGKSRRIPWRAVRDYARRCLVGAQQTSSAPPAEGVDP